MKKMLTLLIAAGAFISVQAQTSKDEARKVVLGQPKNSGSTPAPTRNGRDVVLGGGNDNTRNYPDSRTYPNSTQAQVDQVNREYDIKINSIRNNVHLSQAEKERMIAQLEKDRAKRLREIRGQYKSKNKKHDDDGDEHHDNGKHKGWEKGKGNQGSNKHD